MDAATSRGWCYVYISGYPHRTSRFSLEQRAITIESGPKLEMASTSPMKFKLWWCWDRFELELVRCYRTQHVLPLTDLLFHPFTLHPPRFPPGPVSPKSLASPTGYQILSVEKIFSVPKPLALVGS